MIKVNSGDYANLFMLAMNMLLEGNTHYLAMLRHQFATARIKDVEEDGYGIFINIDISDSTKIVEPEVDFGRIDGLIGLNTQGKEICGFALFISDGAISSLDGYPAGGDTWPKEEIELVFATYDKNDEPFYSDKRGTEALKRYKRKTVYRTADGMVWR